MNWESWSWLFSRYRTIGLLMGAFAVVSVVWSACAGEGTRKWLVAFWALAPAIYFFCELHWAKSVIPTDSAAVESSQEAAGKIWAGVVAALSVLYLKD